MVFTGSSDQMDEQGFTREFSFLPQNETVYNHSSDGTRIPLDIYNILPADDIISEIKSHFYAYHQAPVAVLILLYIVTFLLGFVGNILVVYIFTKNDKMRTVTNLFLVNLAVCDLLVVCVCMPFSVAVEVYVNWIYGEIWCKLVNFSQTLSVASSIITLTVISAERFHAVRHPLQARAFMSRSRVCKIIIAIWLVSALVALPALFVRKQEVVEEIYTVKIYTCTEVWLSGLLKHIYSFSLTGILYIGPMVFICHGYFNIGVNLWRPNSTLHATIGAAHSDNAHRNLSGRRKVARMLFVVSMLFALSWLPFQIVGPLMEFLPEQVLETKGKLIRYMFSYAIWMGHANSSINPICYCIMSRSFKHVLRYELTRCCCKRKYYTRQVRAPSLSQSMTLSTAGSVRSKYSTTCRNGYHRVGGASINCSTVSSQAMQLQLRGMAGSSGTPDLLQHVKSPM